MSRNTDKNHYMNPPEAGMIRKNELAMLYFPNATSPKVATDNLHRWINRCEPLSHALAKTVFRTTSWYFTPRQVELIYEYLGEP